MAHVRYTFAEEAREDIHGGLIDYETRFEADL